MKINPVSIQDTEAQRESVWNTSKFWSTKLCYCDILVLQRGSMVQVWYGQSLSQRKVQEPFGPPEF